MDGDAVPDCVDICPGFDDRQAFDMMRPFDPPKCPGACCLPNNGCMLNLTRDACGEIGGRYLGDGSTFCPHDAQGNCIPTVSEWGFVVLTLLLLIGATMCIARRQMATAP